MKRSRIVLVGVAVGMAMAVSAGGYPIQNVDRGAVKVTRGFWHDRLETNRVATLRTCLAKCNETPRIANFTNAANRAWGTFGGIPFDDSDVYKVMEGAAYVLAAHPDKALEDYVSWFIGQVAKAQEPDGYLYTARTLGHPCSASTMMGPTRWSNLPSSHEFYNVGHMYEAAVAWQRTTGRRDFLDIAQKSANLICRTFGPGADQLHETSGHQEIELALCKLFVATGERKYLDEAKYILDRRGHREGRINPGACNAGIQDHLPVVEQTEAIGHAVRAGYLYCGMADVAALSGDTRYVAAIRRLWDDVVQHQLALHGGVGAHRSFKHPKHGDIWEGFNGAYELPNDSGDAYYETCAAIANALWNERMFRWTGESKYVDVLERVIYNGFLSGISLRGDEFFYPNPLASKGGYKRSKWFGCSCCPVNDVRFMPQIPAMAFATKGDVVYWNLFMEGEAKVGGLTLKVETEYPWKGDVKLTVVTRGATPSHPEMTRGATPSHPEMTRGATPSHPEIRIRIPGWAVGRPVPSDLYEQTEPSSFMEVAIAVNGAALNGCPGEDGYVAIRRKWAPGDVVTLSLPMPVKRMRANAKLAYDRGRLAVERGPIVYAAEGVDNGGACYGAKLPEKTAFTDDAIVIGDKKFPALKAANGLKLVPYCVWGNREPGNALECWFGE